MPGAPNRTGYDYGSTNNGAYAYNPDYDRPPSGEKSLLRRGDDGPKAHPINLVELVFVPWVLLVLILCCFLSAGIHGETPILWVMPIVLVGCVSFWLRHHYRAGNSEEVTLGILCLAAIVIGTGVGMYANSNLLREYYRINQGASYFNVYPSETADSKLDATTIVFTNTTYVDIRKSYGFVDATDSSAPIYCVAPVTDGKDSSKRMQFWAAGINCCGTQAKFECGDADNKDAHGGIVFPGDLQVYQAGGPGTNFRNAIQGALDAHGLTSGNNVLLLTWVQNPMDIRNGLWIGTIRLFGIFAIVYLAISGMSAYIVLPIIQGHK